MEALIFIAMGLALLYVAFNLRKNTKKIAINGIETEGVVFDLIQSDTSESNARYPLIRFVTAEKVWITERYNISTVAGIFKKGQKVTVVYNSDDPSKFSVKSPLTTVAPMAAIALSLALVAIGVYKLLHKSL
jgi:hypothetical protein